MNASLTITSLAVFAFSLSLAGCAAEPRPEPRVEPTGAPLCASQKSDVESNKAAVLKFQSELWDKKNPDAAVTSGVLAPDVVNHAAIPEAQGAEGMRTLSKKVITAFPDLTMKVIDVTAEGDRVVLRNTMEGTQTAALEFKNPIPATGKHVKLEQVHTFRFKDGKVVEMWMSMDHLDMMKQLGMFPPPKKDGAP
jgi:predicted ester cyclase